MIEKVYQVLMKMFENMEKVLVKKDNFGFHLLKRYPGLYIASKYKEYHNLLPSIRGEQYISGLQTAPTNYNWALLSKLGDKVKPYLVEELKSRRATGRIPCLLSLLKEGCA